MVYTINPYLLKLQIIEPDRIFTPQGKEKEYTEGVKFDSNGRIESYRISNKHPLDSEFTGKEEIKEEVLPNTGKHSFPLYIMLLSISSLITIYEKSRN